MRYKDQKKPFKDYKKNNKIQTDKNIEKMQHKQQEMIFKYNFIYDKL